MKERRSASARAVFAAASRSAIVFGSIARAFAVLTRSSGTTSVIEMPRGRGRRIGSTPPTRGASERTSPPEEGGRHVVRMAPPGGPPRERGRGPSRGARASGWRARARPRWRPRFDPNPRATGMRERTEREMVGTGLPARRHRWRNAARIGSRCGSRRRSLPLRGARSRKPSGNPSRHGVRAEGGSARPRQSKPGLRFEVDAGTVAHQIRAREPVSPRSIFRSAWPDRRRPSPRSARPGPRARGL